MLNREFGGDFDLDRFEHVARYDAEAERMDIRLRSLAEQTVRLDGLDLTVRFAAGEEMRTEISTKFTREAAGGRLPRGRPAARRVVHRRRRGLRAQLGFGLKSWTVDTGRKMEED